MVLDLVRVVIRKFLSAEMLKILRFHSPRQVGDPTFGMSNACQLIRGMHFTYFITY